MNSNGGSVVDLGSYDWRQNRPKTPNKWTIKLGNTSFDFQKQPLILIVLLCAFILLTYFKFSGSTLKSDPVLVNFQEFRNSKVIYNNTYPLTQPTITPYGMKYQIAVIADLDTGKFLSEALLFAEYGDNKNCSECHKQFLYTTCSPQV